MYVCMWLWSVNKCHCCVILPASDRGHCGQLLRHLGECYRRHDTRHVTAGVHNDHRPLLLCVAGQGRVRFVNRCRLMLSMICEQSSIARTVFTELWNLLLLLRRQIEQRMKTLQSFSEVCWNFTLKISVLQCTEWGCSLVHSVKRLEKIMNRDLP